MKTKVRFQRQFLFDPEGSMYQCYAFVCKAFRAPFKGEWYLSGAPGYEQAYYAPNDLGAKFRIVAPIVQARALLDA